jgi:hypothetical protein
VSIINGARREKCWFGKIPQRAEERLLAKCEAIVFTSEVDFERCPDKKGAGA